MSRRPASDPTVTIPIDGHVLRFATSTLRDFPDAPAFTASLVARDVALITAMEYARLVAKLKHQGHISEPSLIIHRTPHTAANAYWRWVEESYAARVLPVTRVFSKTDVREHVMQLRVSSLVPPLEGKTIPRLATFGTLELDGASLSAHATAPRIEWVPCDKWTLHVPVVKNTAAHKDPCITCTPIEISATQLEVIAVAFEQAWGHRELYKMPPDTLLFGQPPRVGAIPARADEEPTGRVVALLRTGPLSGTVETIGGVVSRDPDVFIERLKQNADVVVLSRAAVGDSLSAVLGAVSEMWGGAASA